MGEGFLKVEMIQIKTKSKFKTIQRRLQSNPDNGYGVGHAEGRRRGQDDDPKGEVRQSFYPTLTKRSFKRQF